MAALIGALVASLATAEVYGDGMSDVFPLIADGHRTPLTQAIYQGLALLVALAFALVGGVLVGFILKLPILGSPPDTQCFEDEIYWEVPEEDGGQGQMTAVTTEDFQKRGME